MTYTRGIIDTRHYTDIERTTRETLGIDLKLTDEP